jgi:hypothetical protein
MTLDLAVTPNAFVLWRCGRLTRWCPSNFNKKQERLECRKTIATWHGAWRVIWL